MKIRQLHIGNGHHVGPLTFFPVWAEGPATTGITSGAAAQLSVAELASGPAVNRLAVTNNDTRPALLLEGELLEGGHQHRVCAVDVIIAPGKTTEVPTFCVEQGRWGGTTVHGRSGRRAPLNVRAELQWRPRGEDGEHRRQHRVWERVSRFQGVNGVSPTSSLVDHMTAQVREAGSRRPQQLPAPIEGQRGVVIGFGGKALMLELFGNHELLVQHYGSLVAAAMMDLELGGSTVPPARTPDQSARDLAVRVMELGLSGKPTVSEAVIVSGVAHKDAGRPALVAHPTGWDAIHPLMLA